MGLHAFSGGINAIHNTILIRTDRSPGVPVDFEQIDFFGSKKSLFVCLKSSNVKPGSLRKSSGDVRDHFLNIWLQYGTYNLFIFINYVICLHHFGGHFWGSFWGVICRKSVFRRNSGKLFGEFALWGRQTHFRQIEFAGNGVEKPYSGQSIPIRGQAQGFLRRSNVVFDYVSVLVEFVQVYLQVVFRIRDWTRMS